MTDESRTRRKLLAAGGTALTAGLAGCSLFRDTTDVPGEQGTPDNGEHQPDGLTPDEDDEPEDTEENDTDDEADDEEDGEDDE